MEMSLIIFLVLILSIVLYYELRGYGTNSEFYTSLGVDMASINDKYIIPIAILFLLITTGGFTGNNGLSGDFGLDYCNDNDRTTTPMAATSIDETERVLLHSNSFFACELGHVNGVVDLGWIINTAEVRGAPSEVNPWYQAMILNHENYKSFVNGETYEFSNFHLSNLQSWVGAGQTSEYKIGITLHSDTYFFVVDRDYGTNPSGSEFYTSIGGKITGRDLFGPNSPTGSTANPLYFYYVVDLDYDTSGVVTTN
jgi:hypothetical protein